MNRFVPQSGPPRGAGDNPYSDYEAPHSGLQASMERPTPEQEAERAKFDLCKGLLDSIFAKVPEATIASHKAQPFQRDQTILSRRLKIAKSITSSVKKLKVMIREI